MIALPVAARWHSPTVHVIGLSVMFLAPGLVVCALVEWGSTSSHDEMALLVTATIAASLGGLAWRCTTADATVGPVSVFGIVAWTWVVCSLVGAVPFVAGSMFSWDRVDDAVFESVSGFTCTGSSVLTDIEAHGRGVLLWRQMTQWYGGMGMVVLAVTVLPHLGVGGLALLSAESPGHEADRLAPRVTETAKRLWTIYAGITVAIVVMLWVSPSANLHDAVSHAMATAATGGYSTYNASVGHFDSLLVEVIVIVGMLVCAIDFTVHARFLRGEPTAHLRSADTIVFVSIVAVAIVGVTVANWAGGLADPAGSLRDSSFNVASLASSSGFGNVRPDGIGDFVLWGAFGQLILLALMVVGGNVGSTAGGLKVFRLTISWRHVGRELRRLRHPSGVFPVKSGSRSVPEDIVASALAFVALFTLALVVGTIALAATGAEPLTAASGAISAMSNMGPALGDAGPTSNFTVFTRPARGILMVLMLVGRLEIYAVLLMFAAPGRSIRRRRRRGSVRRVIPAGRAARDGSGAAGLRRPTGTP